MNAYTHKLSDSSVAFVDENGNLIPSIKHLIDAGNIKEVWNLTDNRTAITLTDNRNFILKETLFYREEGKLTVKTQ